MCAFFKGQLQEGLAFFCVCTSESTREALEDIVTRVDTTLLWTEGRLVIWFKHVLVYSATSLHTEDKLI